MAYGVAAFLVVFMGLLIIGFTGTIFSRQLSTIGMRIR